MSLTEYNSEFITQLRDSVLYIRVCFINLLKNIFKLLNALQSETKTKCEKSKPLNSRN